MGKPLIMGRKTYQSIGRPLPEREIIRHMENCAVNYGRGKRLKSVAKS
jgi:hypothetical protein